MFIDGSVSTVCTLLYYAHMHCRSCTDPSQLVVSQGRWSPIAGQFTLKTEALCTGSTVHRKHTETYIIKYIYNAIKIKCIPFEEFMTKPHINY